MYADHALARRLERLEGTACARFVEARASLNPASTACWIEVAGTYAMFDTPTSPITQSFGLGLFEPVTPQELDILESFFFTRNAPAVHEVCPLAGVETYALLAERGYQPIELTSVLYRPTSEPLSAVLNPAFNVRIVDPSEQELWAQVGAQGWSTEFPAAADFMVDLGKAIAAKDDSYAFLAELGGIPAAAGALSLDQGGALLAGASTIAAARRQGAQLMLLDARLKFARERGCDLAMMCAAPGSTSQRNAERNGFKIAYTRVKWSRSKG